MSIKAVVMVGGVLGALSGLATAQDRSGGGGGTGAPPSPYGQPPPDSQAQPPWGYQAPGAQAPGAQAPGAQAPGAQAPGAQAPRSRLGHGATFEASLGLGFLRFSPDSDEIEAWTERGIAGLNLGLGGWISPRTALSVRLASVTHSDDFLILTGGFFGGALQYWPSDRAWLGAGVGVGLVSAQLQNGEASDSESALGLDFRAGYSSFISGQHALNFSVEVTPAFFDRTTLTGIALLIGYQYL